jgi:hypothetical protein
MYGEVPPTRPSNCALINLLTPLTFRNDHGTYIIGPYKYSIAYSCTAWNMSSDARSLLSNTSTRALGRKLEMENGRARLFYRLQDDEEFTSDGRK